MPVQPTHTTRKRPAKRFATARVAPPWLALLQCPDCAGPLVPGRPRVIACTQCRREISAEGGILDFVAGRQTTALDKIDYDEFYKINILQSEAQLAQVIAVAGERWPENLGDVLEIGCGTGGFSMAMVKAGFFSRAVLTDVSPSMLAICRDHLTEMGILDRRRIGFATHGGTENCFRAESFDTCIGAWVLHHIADVPHFLGHIHETLKPGGRAFFLEPTRRFHEALIAALADIVAHKLAQGMPPDHPDIMKTVVWIAEIRFNAINSGDPELLAGREDKHLFIGEELERTALEAGFTTASCLPFGHDRHGLGAARTYLGQCAVSQEWLTEVERLLPLFGDRYFSLLQARDQAPSLLVWLTRTAETAAAPTVTPAPPTPVPAALSGLDLRFWLSFSPLQSDGLTRIVVDGWCAAPIAIKTIELTMGGILHKIPVRYARTDVHLALAEARGFSCLNTLCPGLRGMIAFPLAASGPLRVMARTSMGVAVTLGAVEPPPVGQSVTLQR